MQAIQASERVKIALVSLVALGLVGAMTWRRPAPSGIRLAGGSFVQGHDEAERADESPAHRVTVKPFVIDPALVTRAEFTRFVDRTGYQTTAETIGFGMVSHEGMQDWEWKVVHGTSFRHPFDESDHDPENAAFLRDDAPVVMVSWFDAVAYCAAQGKRLPSEVEWDYAMRAGARSTRYPWGDDPIRDGALALNFWQGASHEKNRKDDGFIYVSPVRAFPPNAWGLYDPVGNVWQWVDDVYDPKAYNSTKEASMGDAVVPPDRLAPRVLRGGSWWCGACTCEGNGLWYRGKANPEAPFNNNGFRCAASVQN